MKLAVYVTGHGFGHATRLCEVMRQLLLLLPDIQFLIRTTAPEFLFSDFLSARQHSLTRIAIDVGSIEKNSLETDPRKTQEACEEFYETWDILAKHEARELEAAKVDGVLFDVPPLAPYIASLNSVPSVGVANFTWDQIYAEIKGMESLVTKIRDWYSYTTLGLEVPLGPGAEVFPRREKIPIVARRSEADKVSVREELSIKNDSLLILVALRGQELRLLPEVTHENRGISIIGFPACPHSKYMQLDDRWQPRFQDLVKVADVVLSKPGYGIVSECIANNTPLAMLPRIGFAETEPMLKEAEEYLHALYLTHEDLNNSGIFSTLADLSTRETKTMRSNCDGAEVAAGKILQLISDSH